MPTYKESNYLTKEYLITMNNEHQLLENFQVEELEKRYEMAAWIEYDPYPNQPQ